MSAPAFAWAFEQGEKLELTTSELALLLYMADQANSVGSFFTGQPKMARATRMTQRNVRKLIPRLEDRGLIKVVATPGLPTKYFLLRQPAGEEHSSAQAPHSAPEHHSAPANGSGVTPSNLSTAPELSSALPRNTVPPNPGILRQQGRNSVPTGAELCSAYPLSVPKKKTLKTRVTAREAKEGFQNSEHQGGTPTPEPIPKAPTLGTTQDCSQALIQPSRQDEPLSIADTLVLLSAHRPPPTPEPEAEPEPEPAANPKAVRRAVASTVYSLRKYAAAEGVAQMRTREQQRTEVLLGPEPPPPAAHRGPVDPVRTVEEQIAMMLEAEAQRAPRPEQPAPKLRLVPDAAPPEELPPIPRGLEATVRAARRALLAHA